MDHHHHHTSFYTSNAAMEIQDQWSCYYNPDPPSHLLGFLEPSADDDDPEDEELGAMKEMMFKVAAMQPVDIDPSTIHKPRRRNVRISDDPQSVAARHRRERISEKIRILQRLVPGGTKMDTASMLDEAIRYVKFLKRQIRVLQSSNNNNNNPLCSATAAVTMTANLFGPSSYFFPGYNNGHDEANY